MKESDYVSLPVALELVKAGVKLEYHAVHCRVKEPRTNTWLNWQLLSIREAANYKHWSKYQEVPAYSLSELLYWLPVGFCVLKVDDGYTCFDLLNSFQKALEQLNTDNFLHTKANTAPDAAAKMVIKLEEKK